MVALGGMFLRGGRRRLLFSTAAVATLSCGVEKRVLCWHVMQSNMSIRKRLSASPFSVPKRQREAPDLQCIICLELVVDAVQVRCCGGLHCRACISKCTSCPRCRKPLNKDSIIPDVNCERLSAAALRACSYADDGCDFIGNRAAVAAHEDSCEFVPRSVLKEKIESLELASSKCIQELAQIKAQKMEMQEAFMKCAMGTKPAEAALRVLYKIPSDQMIYEIDRAAVKGKSHTVCSWTMPEVTVSFQVHESNHNVAVYFATPIESVGLSSGYLAVKLLHPFDVARAKKIRVEKTELNGNLGMGYENFMTSRDFDEYAVNGKYYISS